MPRDAAEPEPGEKAGDHRRRMLAVPGVREMVNLDHIKRGYYSIKALNPTEHAHRSGTRLGRVTSVFGKPAAQGMAVTPKIWDNKTSSPRFLASAPDKDGLNTSG